MSARSGKKWPREQTPTGVSQEIWQERGVLNYILMLWFAQSVAAAFFKVTLLLIDARCAKSPKCHYRLSKKCFKLRFRLGFEKYTFDFCFGSGTEVPSLPPRSSELKPNLNWEKIIFASISSRCLVSVWEIGHVESKNTIRDGGKMRVHCLQCLRCLHSLYCLHGMHCYIASTAHCLHYLYYLNCFTLLKHKHECWYILL